MVKPLNQTYMNAIERAMVPYARVLFPPGLGKYIEMQTNGDYNKFGTCPELKLAMYHLGQLKPMAALDIGCGVGRVSVFLFRYFGWDKTLFYLLDGDSGDEQFGGCYDELNDGYYNSLAGTERFCRQNGLTNFRTLNAEHREWETIPDGALDIAYSIKAIGWQWPITEYLDRIYPKMAPGGTLIFEIRHKFYKTICPPNWSPRQIEAIDPAKYELLCVSYIPDEAILILRKPENQL